MLAVESIKQHESEQTETEVTEEDLEYVDQKLTNGSARIWQDVQTKIRTLLLSSDLTGFKIDDFMYILSIIHT